MAFTYVMILREVRRQSRREFLNVPSDLKEQRQWRKRERKAASIFLVMFLTHVMCWLPFFLLRYQQIYDAFFLPTWASYMFGYLRFASSFLNPCLYVFGKHDFRKAWDYPCKRHQRNRAKSDLVMIMSSNVWIWFIYISDGKRLPALHQYLSGVILSYSQFRKHNRRQASCPNLAAEVKKVLLLRTSVTKRRPSWE